mmetsp:Transcript_19546/g.56898  ORF Transcript_19546/g.56898 Transcript_19546/m.56898 type:complete len:214 (+) Transcript_19546:541-1182(+)
MRCSDCSSRRRHSSWARRSSSWRTASLRGRRKNLRPLCQHRKRRHRRQRRRRPPWWTRRPPCPRRPPLLPQPRPRRASGSSPPSWPCSGMRVRPPRASLPQRSPCASAAASRWPTCARRSRPSSRPARRSPQSTTTTSPCCEAREHPILHAALRRRRCRRIGRPAPWRRRRWGTSRTREALQGCGRPSLVCARMRRRGADFTKREKSGLSSQQ